MDSIKLKPDGILQALRWFFKVSKYSLYAAVTQQELVFSQMQLIRWRRTSDGYLLYFGPKTIDIVSCTLMQLNVSLEDAKRLPDNSALPTRKELRDYLYRSVAVRTFFLMGVTTLFFEIVRLSLNFLFTPQVLSSAEVMKYCGDRSCSDLFKSSILWTEKALWFAYATLFAGIYGGYYRPKFKYSLMNKLAVFETGAYVILGLVLAYGDSQIMASKLHNAINGYFGIVRALIAKFGY